MPECPGKSVVTRFVAAVALNATASTLTRTRYVFTSVSEVNLYANYKSGPIRPLCIPKFPIPRRTTNTAVLVALVILVLAGIMHYACPLRMTRVLVAAIADVEKAYLEALETGLLSSDTVAMLSTYVDPLFPHWSSLRNSLSHSGTLREFFAGRTFTLLHCIREVRVLETHIEVFTSSSLHGSTIWN
ncbi:hypothetical protein B0H13DRAFT_2322338 [Mycena leptocephala]|nr:hypothetical protein B0H13DRAFT_2322338 [Mycena leptocephala]